MHRYLRGVQCVADQGSAARDASEGHRIVLCRGDAGKPPGGAGDNEDVPGFNSVMKREVLGW